MIVAIASERVHMKQHLTTPSVLVIFGVTGNLSQHMLLPALYHLESQGLLPDKFTIVGIFRREPDLDTLFKEAEIQILRTHQDVNSEAFAKLQARVHTIKMDSTDASHFHRL